MLNDVSASNRTGHHLVKDKIAVELVPGSLFIACLKLCGMLTEAASLYCQRSPFCFGFRASSSSTNTLIQYEHLRCNCLMACHMQGPRRLCDHVLRPNRCSSTVVPHDAGGYTNHEVTAGQTRARHRCCSANSVFPVKGMGPLIN